MRRGTGLDCVAGRAEAIWAMGSSNARKFDRELSAVVSQYACHWRYWCCLSMELLPHELNSRPRLSSLHDIVGANRYIEKSLRIIIGHNSRKSSSPADKLKQRNPESTSRTPQ
jgi:hypothetical protein